MGMLTLIAQNLFGSRKMAEKLRKIGGKLEQNETKGTKGTKARSSDPLSGQNSPAQPDGCCGTKFSWRKHFLFGLTEVLNASG
jgi:hypothetical protein